ncbi:MAG: peroxiredoxin [Thaumarchaeota archaeon]|nr:peroxiredoxin [Nitrososphaerota archaeon]
MGGKVREGDRAPDFALESQDGKVISLRDYVGSRNVVLYFYPKDFTMGCTAEARSFSENYAEVNEMGAEVIGVSSDSTESHSSFAGECDVKFPLLSDKGGKVREIYGVRSTLGLLPGRVTFIIDKQGVVRRIFSSQINPRRHVSEAIEALKTLPR